MSLFPVVGWLLLNASLRQESVVPPPPRTPLPRPVTGAPLATVNDNERPAGTRSGNTLTLALDIVEAAWQPEGEHDPVVRILAFAEPGKPPVVPGPLLRAPRGTTVRLTLRNRSVITEWFHEFPKPRPFESALVFNGKAWPYNERLTFAVVARR